MVGTSDGWIVGNLGTILRWDGSSWSSETSPTTNTLWSIYMVTVNDGWAVGTFGTIIRYSVTPPVGGVGVPVDKFVLLAPYIALASTIVVVTAVTAIYVKRVKRKKKQ
jgi:hypothetical protein